MELKRNGTASFVLRIWWEEGEKGPIWRGRIEHAISGDNRYFQKIQELFHFIEAYTGPLEAEGGGDEQK